MPLSSEAHLWSLFSFLKNIFGSEEMAQGLKVLAALAEDPGSNPSTHIVDPNCNSSFRGSETLFWPLWAWHTLATQTYVQAKNKKTKNKKQKNPTNQPNKQTKNKNKKPRPLT